MPKQEFCQDSNEFLKIIEPMGHHNYNTILFLRIFYQITILQKFFWFDRFGINGLRKLLIIVYHIIDSAIMGSLELATLSHYILFSAYIPYHPGILVRESLISANDSIACFSVLSGSATFTICSGCWLCHRLFPKVNGETETKSYLLYIY